MLLEKGVRGEMSDRNIGKAKYNNIYSIKTWYKLQFQMVGKKKYWQAWQKKNIYLIIIFIKFYFF